MKKIFNPKLPVSIISVLVFVVMLTSPMAGIVRANQPGQLRWFLVTSDIFREELGYGYKCLGKVWTNIGDATFIPGFETEDECNEAHESGAIHIDDSDDDENPNPYAWVHVDDSNSCIHADSEQIDWYKEIENNVWIKKGRQYDNKISCDARTVWTEGQYRINILDTYSQGDPLIIAGEESRIHPYFEETRTEIRGIVENGQLEIFSEKQIPFLKTDGGNSIVPAGAIEGNQYFRRGLYEADVIGGLRGGVSYPQEPITRGEFASMIRRTMDILKDLSGENFPDISIEHKNYEDVLALRNFGILNGRTDGNFYSEDPIPRDEAVSMMMRILEKKGVLIDKEFENPFPDVDIVSVHKKNILALHHLRVSEDNGDRVISGYSDSEFKPKNMITRHQASKVVNKSLNAYSYYLLLTDQQAYSDRFV